MLAHRQRRWLNIRPTMGQRLVFSGKGQCTVMPVITGYSIVVNASTTTAGQMTAQQTPHLLSQAVRLHQGYIESSFNIC